MKEMRSAKLVDINNCFPGLKKYFQTSLLHTNNAVNRWIFFAIDQFS